VIRVKTVRLAVTVVALDHQPEDAPDTTRHHGVDDVAHPAM
jgi:hypothetical protein